jgi:hypothetical protein
MMVNCRICGKALTDKCRDEVWYKLPGNLGYACPKHTLKEVNDFVQQKIGAKPVLSLTNLKDIETTPSTTLSTPKCFGFYNNSEVCNRYCDYKDDCIEIKKIGKLIKVKQCK